MNPTVFSGAYATIEEATCRLQDLLLAHSRDSTCAGYSCRWEAEIPDTEPLAWLNHHDNLIRMYSSHREKRMQIAAIGIADMLRFKDRDVDFRDALDYIFARLNVLPVGMRYYGGMRFSGNADERDATWKRFGKIRFVVPAIELIREDPSCLLAVNYIPPPEGTSIVQDLSDLIQSIRTPPSLAAAHLPLPAHRTDLPERPQWKKMIKQAHEDMATGELKKVVLARRSSFDFNEPLHPMALLLRLHEASPDSFHFCFNYGNEIAFIGATPERLYHRKGRQLESEELAGTRPRGATEEDDAWLASDLAGSPKERQEHKLVADFISDTLSKYAQSLVRAEVPDILKLKYVQHLRTVIRANMNVDATDTDILMALHPTPAVGGFPKDLSVKTITGLEPFDRGWYAAPIGWAMRDEVEFAVAIRCALVEGSRLSLFSGAGIMPESDPDQEWREIESKIANFLRILTS